MMACIVSFLVWLLVGCSSGRLFGDGAPPSESIFSEGDHSDVGSGGQPDMTVVANGVVLEVSANTDPITISGDQLTMDPSRGFFSVQGNGTMEWGALQIECDEVTFSGRADDVRCDGGVRAVFDEEARR